MNNVNQLGNLTLLVCPVALFCEGVAFLLVKNRGSKFKCTPNFITNKDKLSKTVISKNFFEKMPTFYFPMKPSDIYTRRGRGDNNPPSLSRYSRTSFMQLPESPSPHKRRQSRFEIFPQQNNNRRGSSINFDFYQSMNSSNGDYNSTNYSNFSGAESSQNVDSKSKKIPQ